MTDNATVPAIGDALLRLFREDADVAGYYTGGVLDSEVDDAWLGEGFAPPVLLVALDEMEYTRGLGGDDNLVTVWQITDVRPTRSSTGTARWLRARTLLRLMALLSGTRGRLVDADDAPVTDALLTIQRIGAPILGPDKTIRTRIKVGLSSQVDGTLEFRR